jgi:hypothetical protein
MIPSSFPIPTLPASPEQLIANLRVARTIGGVVAVHQQRNALLFRLEIGIGFGRYIGQTGVACPFLDQHGRQEGFGGRVVADQDCVDLRFKIEIAQIGDDVLCRMQRGRIVAEDEGQTIQLIGYTFDKDNIGLLRNRRFDPTFPVGGFDDFVALTLTALSRSCNPRLER